MEIWNSIQIARAQNIKLQMLHHMKKKEGPKEELDNMSSQIPKQEGPPKKTTKIITGSQNHKIPIP